jgi:hypothetical protein
LALAAAVVAAGDEDAAARLWRAQEFHLRALERTGVLVPLNVYLGDVQENPAYTGLIALKWRFETVPCWLVVNPASVPGKTADPNYTRAIDRLCGAGCVVLRYVTTGYAKRAAADVRADVDAWLKLYPQVQGMCFDEMTTADTGAGAAYQAGLSKYARDAEFWPAAANPGDDTPGRYFSAGAAGTRPAALAAVVGCASQAVRDAW